MSKPVAKMAKAEKANRDNYNKQYAATHKRKLEQRRAVRMRYLYGIEPEHYAKLLAAQAGVCAICGKPETKIVRGRLLQLSVDHDHVTGEVRQLLCQRCNAGHGK